MILSKEIIMNEQQTQLIKSLRDFASYLETREFDTSAANFSGTDIFLFCDTGNSFLENTKHMGGFKRNFTDYSATLDKKFGKITFRLHSSREYVCEKVKVGVKVIPAEPERIIPAKPERVIDKYEYKCPESLLKGEN